jgi:hypothetical protein
MKGHLKVGGFELFFQDLQSNWTAAPRVQRPKVSLRTEKACIGVQYTVSRPEGKESSFDDEWVGDGSCSACSSPNCRRHHRRDYL